MWINDRLMLGCCPNGHAWIDGEGYDKCCLSVVFECHSSKFASWEMHLVFDDPIYTIFYPTREAAWSDAFKILGVAV
jgi:hypothetical protein